MASLVVQWCSELEEGNKKQGEYVAEDEAYFLRVSKEHV